MAIERYEVVKVEKGTDKKKWLEPEFGSINEFDAKQKARELNAKRTPKEMEEFEFHVFAGKAYRLSAAWSAISIPLSKTK
jgi:hypothetical protein